ncbi:MAG: hypothetical protein E7616_03700 [Ruminococcaceae bacterium]|nr:hypothetical protein [Oscillospiraceae bacterium]
MVRRNGMFGTVVLFVFAVLGFALASLVYMVLPVQLLPDVVKAPKTVFEVIDSFGGMLLSLSIAFFVGFLGCALPFLAMITFIRFFSLTFTCYLLCLYQSGVGIAQGLFLSGIKGLMFLVFCRLSYLFACAYRKNTQNRKRYFIQFLGDYLFQCGIGSLLSALPVIHNIL